MIKATKNNTQIANKHQAINSTHKTAYTFLEFDNWDLFEICYLRFGILER